ncbi:hypothetical protein [Amycolatopsis sp. cmx-4-68]|uniref:hypothetical protein n=1 Tax=Amycolatopsis sp. cmx-4-68 TaxID=2790938 RepID=UPI00397870CC
MRLVRTIDTVTLDGSRIQLRVGLVERDGDLTPALQLNDGPIALIPIDDVGSQLLADIRQTLADWYRKQGGLG